MKKYLLLCAFSLFVMMERGHALAVIDASNLAQNVVAAQEAIMHTQQQIQALTNQLNQYKRMLQDAANPGSWAWGDIHDTLDQLRNSMNSLKSISNSAGGMNSLLDSFGSHSKYQESGAYYGTGNTALYGGDLAGMNLQKESADDMLKLIQEQQESMQKYSDDLEKLKRKASSAEGQQEAIQAGNQLAVRQK